jgi:hypothetical protein
MAGDLPGRVTENGRKFFGDEDISSIFERVNSTFAGEFWKRFSTLGV